MREATREALETAAMQCSDNAIEMEHSADVLFDRDDCGEEHPEFCERIAEFLMAEAEKQWTMHAGFLAQAAGLVCEPEDLPEHSS